MYILLDRLILFVTTSLPTFHIGWIAFWTPTVGAKVIAVVLVGMYAACTKDNGSADPRSCGWWNPDVPPPPPPPVSPTCLAAMKADCGSVQQNSTMCLACMTAHSTALGQAGCTTIAAEMFCGIDPNREHDPHDVTYHPGDSYENTVPLIPKPQQHPFAQADPPMVLFDISKDPNGTCSPPAQKHLRNASSLTHIAFDFDGA